MEQTPELVHLQLATVVNHTNSPATMPFSNNIMHSVMVSANIARPINVLITVNVFSTMVRFRHQLRCVRLRWIGMMFKLLLLLPHQVTTPESRPIFNWLNVLGARSNCQNTPLSGAFATASTCVWFSWNQRIDVYSNSAREVTSLFWIEFVCLFKLSDPWKRIFSVRNLRKWKTPHQKQLFVSQALWFDWI